MDYDSEALIRRVERLERAQRRWRIILLGMLALWVSFGGAGQAIAQRMLDVQSITASRVTADSILAADDIRVGRGGIESVGPLWIQGKVKVDSDIEANTLYVNAVVIREGDRTLARLGGFEEADRRLVFYGPKGKSQLELSANDTGSVLVLSAPQGPRIVAATDRSMDDFTYAGLAIDDAKGDARLKVEFSGKNDDEGPVGRIAIINRDKRSAFGASGSGDLWLAGDDGSMRLTTWGAVSPVGVEISDRARSKRITMGFESDAKSTTADQTAVLRANGPDRKHIWEVSASAHSRKR